MKRLSILICMGLLCLSGLTPARAAAADAAPADRPAGDDDLLATPWRAEDITGRPVTVPADRPTLMVFVMAGQERSLQAMRTVQQHVKAEDPVQVIAMLSGPDAPADAATLIEAVAWRWPLVVDPQHRAAGRMKIHAWPTTLVIDPRGREQAHLAGLPQTFARDLAAHVAFALGRLTRAQLDQRIGDHAPAGDGSSDEAPSRSLRMIERLMERGEYATARQMLDGLLEQHPDEPALRAAMIRVLLQQGEAARAWAMLQQLDAASLPAWRLRALRGLALMELRRLDAARAELEAALQLNPQPADCHYWLGLIAQQQERWPDAARHYRSAVEATAAGKAMKVSDQPDAPDAQDDSPR